MAEHMGNIMSEVIVRHHVADGASKVEFRKAISECNHDLEVTGGQQPVAVDVQACVKAREARLAGGIHGGGGLCRRWGRRMPAREVRIKKTYEYVQF
jgi:hypothetical protein